ncbi:MAG TPA: Tm-1-like ATP-binding domain-containing protein [Anaerolineales bacterium]|nr:Tm-1-like ATP-binding domain-containing protein [Anaerolineales bacterium]
MPKTIAVIGALDTKGPEFAFVKAEIERRGHRALVVNTAVVGAPTFEPDIPAERVAEAGGASLAALRAQADRGAAMEVMTRGVARVVKDLYDEGKIDGVLGMGGSAGTIIGTSAMRALPVGVPKVMVSTLASGDVKPYVGTKDVVMIHSVVDVAGVNRVSARIYANAVGAMVGMVETSTPQIASRPVIAASMFGNTTPVVTRCRETFEKRGFEVLIFHAVGTGGQTMEDLIRAGYVNGVADITTTEWADELVGGVLTAGPERLDAAAEKGVPQVIAPGCLDMVNFWVRETVPAQFEGRRFYQWNPNVTLMRTTPEENAELGRILAEKASKSSGPVAFFLPLKGVSMLDAPGKEFWWPEADQALFDAIKRHRRPDIPVHELDHNINDEPFADAVAEKLLEFLK